MRAFAQADRFMSEVQSRKLRPAYVFVGDEVFFRKRCREAILEHLVPPELRDFSLFDFDLAETDLAEYGKALNEQLAEYRKVFDTKDSIRDQWVIQYLALPRSRVAVSN